MKMFKTLSSAFKNMTVLLMIDTYNSVCSSSQVYNNQPYGSEMCNQLATRMKGCFSGFSRETYTCIISARQHFTPEICFTTKKKFERCMSLKSKEEAFRNRSEPVQIDRHGAVISGSIQQLLNSVKVGIQIQTLIMLPNKQLLLLDVSFIKLFLRQTVNGSKTIVSVFSDLNLEQSHSKKKLTKYEVCLKGQLKMQNYCFDKNMSLTKRVYRYVIWHQFSSLLPFAYYLYRKGTLDGNSVDVKTMVKLIRTACDVTLLETKRRRRIHAIIVPSSNGKIGFYMTTEDMAMVCKLISKYEPTDFIKCRNIVSHANEVLELNVKSLRLLMSTPWKKYFERGNAVKTLNELIQLIQMGHRVKIVIGQGVVTVVEAAVVFIQRRGLVCGQFLSTWHYRNRLLEIWRHVSSKSTVTSNYDVYHKTRIYSKVSRSRRHVTWFVDPYPWEFALHVRENGTVVSGSRKLLVKNFQQGPLKVRVETTLKKYTIYESAARVKIDLQNEIIVAYMTPHFHLEMNDKRTFKRPKYNSQKIYCTVSSTALRSCEEIPSMVKTEVNVETRWFIKK